MYIKNGSFLFSLESSQNNHFESLFTRRLHAVKFNGHNPSFHRSYNLLASLVGEDIRNHTTSIQILVLPLTSIVILRRSLYLSVLLWQ
jgi:hypothetical protein